MTVDRFSVLAISFLEFALWFALPSLALAMGAIVALEYARHRRDARTRSIREAESRHAWAATLFESAPLGMGVVDAAGHWRRVNREVERITGYTSAELTGGMTWQQITTPETLPDDEALVRSILSGELRRYSYEKQYRRKDGEDVPVRIHVAPLDLASVPHFVVSIEDLAPILHARNATKACVESLTDQLERARARALELERSNDELTTKAAAAELEAARMAARANNPHKAD